MASMTVIVDAIHRHHRILLHHSLKVTFWHYLHQCRYHRFHVDSPDAYDLQTSFSDQTWPSWCPTFVVVSSRRTSTPGRESAQVSDDVSWRALGNQGLWIIWTNLLALFTFLWFAIIIPVKIINFITEQVHHYCHWPCHHPEYIVVQHHKSRVHDFLCPRDGGWWRRGYIRHGLLVHGDGHPRAARLFPDQLRGLLRSPHRVQLFSKSSGLALLQSLQCE